MRPSTLPAVSVLAALTIAAAPAFAQDAPDTSPAAQVQKLGQLIGTWEGAGQVTQGPATPSEKWTSKSTCRWVLGGHFVREDARIEFSSTPVPLEFVSLYGWDRENQRYVQIEISNMGVGRLSEVHFTADGQMVTATAGVEMGQPVVERWVTEVDDGKMTFSGHRAEGAGPFFEMVSGVADRTDETAGAIDIVNAAFMPDMAAAPAKAIGKFDGAVGSYKLEGWLVPSPGAPKSDFSGTEVVRKIFGGTVLEMVSKGDPVAGMPDYEGIGWITWDQHKKCFDMIFANNMGEVDIQEGRGQDHRIIFNVAGVKHGQPVSCRHVLVLGQDGSFQELSAHEMNGSRPAEQVFEGRYTKK